MATSNGLSLLGVNLSGAEYGSATPQNPGRADTDYVLPGPSEIDYYAAKGLNVIRLPFLWERMQATPGGALNQVYLQQIDAAVAAANAKGIAVDLDLHNYGSGFGKLLGSADLPGSALADLWGRLATHFSSANVLFGLMNEPSAQGAQAWAGIAAGAVAAIRAAGAITQEILVPGTAWDGAAGWVSSGNAAALSAAVADPNHNIAYEVHQYFDADASGTSTAVVSPTIGVERLTAATQWAEATGNRLFLGEFAAGTDAASLSALDNTLSYMAQHADAWQGATYWAGGAWWGSYPFSIEPANGVDKPQMAVLTRYERQAPAAGAAPVQTGPAPIAATVLPGFDAAYYLLHNPDVAAAGMDPAQHFLTYGWHEGRNPDAVFDTGYYLAQNPDVKAAGIDPLLHFTQFGWTEGRLPSLLFDPARYLVANPDVAAARLDPLLHYLTYGQAEGRATFLTGGVAAADPLVSAVFYDRQLGASLMPAGEAGAQQAAAAYGSTGWQAGLNPDPWFDTGFYLTRNPDVAAAHIDPLLHYELFGWKEGRDASAGFSTGGYLAANPDVRAAGLDPLLHYAVYGQAEGRATIPA